MKTIIDFFKHMLYPPKEKSHSMFCLMEKGSMQPGSLSHSIYKRLLETYNVEYEDVNDKNDKNDLVITMSANLQHELELAWQGFLGEVDFDE